MDRFVQMSAGDRRVACEQTSAQLGLPSHFVEKDYWVCWVLHAMFSSPACRDHLVFKGGTSLSKGFGVIQRFSEDIDIVIDRHGLGLDAGMEILVGDGSNLKKRKQRALKEASIAFTREVLESELQRICGETLDAVGAWSLEYAESPDASPELYLRYPASLPSPEGFLPRVKIELGSRSDTEPVERPLIKPYVAVVVDGSHPVSGFIVPTVSPRRTFWEKAMLLTEKTVSRDEDRTSIARLSRHLYDVWCLWEQGVGKEAIRDVELYDRIADHRIRYFRPHKAALELLQNRRINLVPGDTTLHEWRKDYSDMRDMFFTDPPAFDVLIETARLIQETFNSR